MGIRVERWSERGAPNADELRRRMEAEGYVVSEWRDAAGTVHDPHTHVENQSVWVVSGRLELRVNNEQYTLNAGDRDYLPANTEHSALAIGGEAVVYLTGSKC